MSDGVPNTRFTGIRRCLSVTTSIRSRPRRNRSSANPAMLGRSAFHQPASSCRTPYTTNLPRRLPRKPLAMKVGNGMEPTNQRGQSPMNAGSRRWKRSCPMRKPRAHVSPPAAPVSAIVDTTFRGRSSADVPDDARAMREEPFGPLALLSRVRGLDEAIEKANSVPLWPSRLCLHQLCP